MRVSAVVLWALVLIGGIHPARCISLEKAWYDVSAADQSLADQVLAISTHGIPINLSFAWRGVDWGSPATTNVIGWFTPQEALCLALSGTQQVPIPVSGHLFVIRAQQAYGPSHCEYAIVDFGPEWIHPPQADWE